MNKYIGMLTTMLLAPEGLSSSSGAGVESTPGTPGQAAPATDNIYGASESEGMEGAQPDFTDKGKKEGDVLEGADPEQIEAEDTEQELDVNGQSIEKVEKPKEEKIQTLRLDAESIAALRAQAAPAAKETQEPAKLSAEQLKQLLNPVEVTEDVVNGIHSEDPAVRIQTLQNFANATVKNAVSITRVMIQQARKEVEAAIGPLSAAMEQQKSAEARTLFYSEYKHLEKYDKLVRQAAAEIGQDPSIANMDQKAIFKTVADRVMATLKEFGVPITPANLGADGGGGNGTKVPVPNKLSSSGRSGGDNNGQRGKTNNPDADIYQR